MNMHMMKQTIPFKSLCKFPIKFTPFSWSNSSPRNTNITTYGSIASRVKNNLNQLPTIMPAAMQRSKIDEEMGNAGRFRIDFCKKYSTLHRYEELACKSMVDEEFGKNNAADLEEKLPTRMSVVQRLSKINEKMGNAGRFWINYCNKYSTLLRYEELACKSAVDHEFEKINAADLEEMIMLRLRGALGLNKFSLNTLSFWRMIVDDSDDIDDDDGNDDDNNNNGDDGNDKDDDNNNNGDNGNDKDDDNNKKGDNGNDDDNNNGDDDDGPTEYYTHSSKEEGSTTRLWNDLPTHIHEGDDEFPGYESEESVNSEYRPPPE